MRSYLDKDSYFNKMKKKADVQDVLDNLDNYTVEQLANLQGTHFPQWVRDALVRKKEGTSKGDIEARAAEIAERMNAAARAQFPEYEDIPMVTNTQSSYNEGPRERKITSADFVPRDEHKGTILDSSTHGKQDEIPGFEEHMRKVREKMRNKM